MRAPDGHRRPLAAPVHPKRKCTPCRRRPNRAAVIFSPLELNRIRASPNARTTYGTPYRIDVDVSGVFAPPPLATPNISHLNKRFLCFRYKYVIYVRRAARIA